MTITQEAAPGRLLLVSNRLPVTAHFDDGKVTLERSSGGLASGLSGAHEEDSLWIGYPGELPRLTSVQQDAFDRALEELRIVPVYLTRTEVKGFYEEVANGVLWPLMHYRLDHLPLHPVGWDIFQKVSRSFADAIVSAYRPGDLVWIHDYHLMLVPAMVRESLPEARIGFFLHVPFPPAEVFRALPWRRQILEGLLGADLLGFHVQAYADYFKDTCSVLLDVDTLPEGISDHGHLTRVRAFPLGIDTKFWTELAARPDVIRKAEAIRVEANGRKLFVGVDRLDYTKGILRRLTALDLLLREQPGLAEDIQLIQVVFPSREAIESYSTLRRRIDEAVSRINGRHSTTTNAPIHLLSRNLAVEETAALYQAADVMLVTPLRDGMNLVAKEFIACRRQEDGVLILSEFAGAAEDLPGAVPVNPYDVDDMAERMRHAANMDPEEQRSRMQLLRACVQENDVTVWTDAFVAALAESASGREASRESESRQRTPSTH